MKLRFFIPLLCIMLSACTQELPTVDPLPSQEVLQKASQAAQKLDSAQYLVTADFDIDSGNTWIAKGILRMDGTLQNAGEQIRAVTDVTAQVEDELTGNYTLEGTIEVSVMSTDEVYLNIHTLNSEPNDIFFPSEIIRQIAGTWWLLPANDTAPKAATVTPDPRLLQAQAQVVTVTKENGVVPFSGSDAYHYDVELNKEKLITYLMSIAQEKGENISISELEEAFADVVATGELWIDAHNYFVHKLVWDVSALSYANNGLSDFELTVTFRNHNSAPLIEPPRDAKIFSPAALFTMPVDTLMDEELFNATSPDNSDDALDTILRNFNTFE